MSKSLTTEVMAAVQDIPANIDNINLLSSISTEIFAETNNLLADASAANGGAAPVRHVVMPLESNVTTGHTTESGLVGEEFTQHDAQDVQDFSSLTHPGQPSPVAIPAAAAAAIDPNVATKPAGYKRTPEFLKQQWIMRYNELIGYSNDLGHCNVPQREKQLGCWVSTQRTQYKLLLEGRPSQMTQERIDLLNKINFTWDPRGIFTRVYKSNEARPSDQPEGPDRNDRKWMQWYTDLAEFKKQYGHCIVTRSANNSLGIWVQKQRKLYRDRQKGKASKILNAERIELLNKLNFVWELPPGSRPPKEKPQRIPGLLEQRWHERFEQLREYRSEFGDCLVPEKRAEYARLGSWVSSQRKKGENLPENRKRLLDELNFEWDVSSDGKRSKVWNRKLEELRQFKALNGHVNVVPSDAATSSLAEWVSRQRYSYQHVWLGKYSPLSEERIKILNEMSFGWTRQRAMQPVDEWDQKFETLKKYKAEHGNCYVPRNHPELGAWVDNQRLAFKAMFEGSAPALTWDQYSQLEAVGLEFAVRASIPFSNEKESRVAQ